MNNLITTVLCLLVCDAFLFEDVLYLFYDIKNKHSDACNYLPPYKFDVLKIVEYRFSCEMVKFA